ncbi:MAG: hypothetical protein ACLVG5_10260 [Clostridium sp.]
MAAAWAEAQSWYYLPFKEKQDTLTGGKWIRASGKSYQQPVKDNS